MSRIGKTPVSIPRGVEIKVDNRVITIKGPKGTLSIELLKDFNIKVEKEELFVVMEKENRDLSAMHGLYRATINNHVKGVTQGFEKRLTLVGVGFRAMVQGHKLDLQVGFSHPTQLVIPKGITVQVDKNTEIIISGADRQQVGQFAAAVRSIKSPEPYKGKGIRYKEEYVRKKAGKAAAAAKAKTTGA